MSKERPLGISFIGYFYIFGAAVLIITLFTNSVEQFGVAIRFGLPNVPEGIMRVFVSVLSLLMAYGYLKLKKWGYVLMLIYTSYFLVVSFVLSQQYKHQLFYGNVIWSIFVLAYTISNRRYFIKKAA